MSEIRNSIDPRTYCWPPLTINLINSSHLFTFFLLFPFDYKYFRQEILLDSSQPARQLRSQGKKLRKRDNLVPRVSPRSPQGAERWETLEKRLKERIWKEVVPRTPTETNFFSWHRSWQEHYRQIPCFTRTCNYLIVDHAILLQQYFFVQSVWVEFRVLRQQLVLNISGPPFGEAWEIVSDAHPVDWIRAVAFKILDKTMNLHK